MRRTKLFVQSFKNSLFCFENFTFRALPGIRNVFPGSAWWNTLPGISFQGIIYVVAFETNISGHCCCSSHCLFHSKCKFLKTNSSISPGLLFRIRFSCFPGKNPPRIRFIPPESRYGFLLKHLWDVKQKNVLLKIASTRTHLHNYPQHPLSASSFLNLPDGTFPSGRRGVMHFFLSTGSVAWCQIEKGTCCSFEFVPDSDTVDYPGGPPLFTGSTTAQSLHSLHSNSRVECQT